MLLIYLTNTTPRLQYVCDFIFKEVLQTQFKFTTDKIIFKNYEGCKLNYSHSNVDESFYIPPHALLFESAICPQSIQCFKINNNTTAFFKVNDASYPFDIFAAIFYLISRYEEYLPHTKDHYGRYAHQNSLAYNQNFLHLPLVNIWIIDFAKQLKAYYPTLHFLPLHFTYLPTYDIDMAWSYKNKAALRNLGGFVKKPTFERLKTLLGWQKDPFDCYEFLDSLHQQYSLSPIYFFLVAQQNGLYDKNILPTNIKMQQLVKSHAQQYRIGLHPSWGSFENKDILNKEKICLEKIIDTPINLSRQHYIKYTLPQGYNNLIDINISNDYSMGYGNINGFRASVASSFYWYHLPEEKVTTLRIHPFCFMDANCFYHQKLSVTASYDELLHYYKVTKKVNGQLITIFHNSFLGSGAAFKGWALLYKNFISQVQQ